MSCAVIADNPRWGPRLQEGDATWGGGWQGRSGNSQERVVRRASLRWEREGQAFARAARSQKVTSTLLALPTWPRLLVISGN